MPRHYNEANLTTRNGLVPRGVIAFWSGRADQVPAGWALCDGQNGTPDLRDRFLVGAGGQYGVGQTGGQATQTHSHTFSGITSYPINPGGQGHPMVSGGVSDVGAAFADHRHTFSGRTEPTTLDNRPPFYALAFIMKL